MIKKIEIERFSVTSSKPFDQVVAPLEAAILRPMPSTAAGLAVPCSGDPRDYRVDISLLI
jgi:hypothetical protein